VIDLDAKTYPATVGNFKLLSDLGYYDGLPIAYLELDSYAVFGSPNPGPPATSATRSALRGLQRGANASVITARSPCIRCRIRSPGR